MAKTFYLPGAGGSASYWSDVASLLGGESTFLSWPGLGAEPHSPLVRGIDDLVTLVLEQLTEPTNIIAQSMGGLVAVKVALAAPHMVRRLVLAVTSAGLPVADLGGANWRPDYKREYPNAASWIMSLREDLSAELGTLDTPTLLLWGDNDPISPPAVGARLAALLPMARLHVVSGGSHDLAQTHAAEIAPLIAAHLRATVDPQALITGEKGQGR
jgi:pimeloyl-ACP methyl ester carboxylesterase